MKKLKHITEICREIYEKEGFSAVCDYVNKMLKEKYPTPDVAYERCNACDTDAPAWRHVCLACGQPTSPIVGKFCPEPIYFHIIKSGWDADLQRQQVEINCGENGKLLLIKTNEGFVVDVYGQNDLIDTMAIWEDDLNPPDEEESNDPRNFSDVEIEEWKKKWGQSHSEITSNLGYPRSHAESDELLTDDYFWVEKDKKWYNRCASMFTPREQAIADYLYACSTYQNLNE